MIDDQQRDILKEARELEERRVEICAWAISQRVVDLLPEAWAAFMQFDDVSKPMVDIQFPSALYPQDVAVFTDRECRDFVRFVAQLTAEARARVQFDGDD